MTGDKSSKLGLLPHLFRLEYTKMTAVLCRHFGLKNIEIAEDIVSETFLKATEIWSVNGLPDNPQGWLYKVARNKTLDYLKRNHLFEQEIKKHVLTDARENNYAIPDFSEKGISDSQLEMIFNVCDPVNSNKSQISLALQVLCGFGVDEIANAFLTKYETIKKRLFRARENLRNKNFKLTDLSREEIKERLETVLTTIYLLFNEGYFSSSDDILIRKDLCLEAMRLTYILTENSFTNTSKTNALMALICYQSSRLEARINSDRDAVLFEKQDKNLWNSELIEKGNYYLFKACSEGEISKFQLEASIAYWHTIPSESDGNKKWQHILQLYNRLLLLEYSPVTALNRTFAFAKVYGNKMAIEEAEKLNLRGNYYYHSLLGYLYNIINPIMAIDHYTKSLNLTTSDFKRKVLKKEIELLRQRV